MGGEASFLYRAADRPVAIENNRSYNRLCKENSIFLMENLPRSIIREAVYGICGSWQCSCKGEEHYRMREDGVENRLEVF